MKLKRVSNLKIEMLSKGMAAQSIKVNKNQGSMMVKHPDMNMMHEMLNMTKEEIEQELKE